jgi:CoA-transferase family III
LQPVEGVTVASPTVNPPGPLAASRLAEFGASVTKVEPPAGDRPAHASLGRCSNTPLRAPARPTGTGYEGDAGMSGGAFRGVASTSPSTATMHSAPSSRTSSNARCGPSAWMVAMTPAAAHLWARPPANWKPLPHRQISLEPGAVEVVDADFEVSDVARHYAGSTIHFAEETGKLYLPTGNPLPSGQSTIARLASPRKGDWFRRKRQCARLRGCALGCAPRSPFRDDRRKYSGAKLHRRKLIR